MGLCGGVGGSCPSEHHFSETSKLVYFSDSLFVCTNAALTLRSLCCSLSTILALSGLKKHLGPSLDVFAVSYCSIP